MPFFWVAFPSGSSPVGVSTFTEDAAASAASLVGKTPAGWAPSTVGLFPCFTRGVNLYKEEDIESGAIAGGPLPATTRVYGMFAHGELGPSAYCGFASEPIKTLRTSSTL